MLLRVDAWTELPGARVAGHRAVVRADPDGQWQVLCTCGVDSEHLSVAGASLTLVGHLQSAVRGGAAVLAGPGDDGTSGVREPRHPTPPDRSGAAAVDLA